MLLAHRVTGIEVPRFVLAKFGRERTVRSLSDFLQRHVVTEPGSVPDGAVPYEFRILAFRERAAALLSPDFFRPNERDRAVLHLPKAFEPFYYLIRPFRILFDRNAR